MATDFNGNSTDTDTARRQYAMKQAVNNFISAVGDKYNATDADHRISIVTFGSSSSVLQGWTYVNTDGVTTLQGKINALNSPNGATNIAAGMQSAENLMGTDYDYTGNNSLRQKVVIAFTDGVPTTSNKFSTSVATNAILSAKNLKDDGVTVYSVGIFDGVNKSQLHGEVFDYQYYTDVPCSGEVGSIWGASNVASILGGNDFPPIDIPAGNRFLNYLSSNFSTATEIGIESGTYNPGGVLLGNGSGYYLHLLTVQPRRHLRGQTQHLLYSLQHKLHHQLHPRHN